MERGSPLVSVPHRCTRWADEVHGHDEASCMTGGSAASAVGSGNMSKLCNGHWTRPKPGPSLDGQTELASNRPPRDVLRLGLCLHHLQICLQRQYLTH